MSTLLASLALLIGCSNLPVCTNQDADKSAARKIAVFEDVDYESATVTLDLFALELNKEPGSKGYIIVYRGKRDLPGVNLRHALRSKNYLVHLRGLSPDQIVAVDGGVKTCLTTELWIVTSTGTMCDQIELSREKIERLRKFDEYSVYLPGDATDCGWCNYEDDRARLEGFSRELLRNPRLRGYLIAYARPSDRAGTTQKILKGEVAYVRELLGASAQRIVSINGGYRENRMVELWLGPADSPLPNASPTTYPKKQRH